MYLANSGQLRHAVLGRPTSRGPRHVPLGSGGSATDARLRPAGSAA